MIFLVLNLGHGGCLDDCRNNKMMWKWLVSWKLDIRLVTKTTRDITGIPGIHIYTHTHISLSLYICIYYIYIHTYIVILIPRIPSFDIVYLILNRIWRNSILDHGELELGNPKLFEEDNGR